MLGLRKVALPAASMKKPVFDSPKESPHALHQSAFTATTANALRASEDRVVKSDGIPFKSTTPKSTIPTARKGASGVSDSSPHDKSDCNNASKKKVTIAEYDEYEGEDDYQSSGDDNETYGSPGEEFEGDETGIEDWDGHENEEDYEEEYEDEDDDDEHYDSEESEGWNVFDPWYLWNDLDGSRMAANFKRFHALNRDMAPERLRKKINPCPYAEPFIIKKEASCPMLFEDFLELPGDIRESIWEYALPQESRVVVICQHSGAYVKCAGPDVLATQVFGGKQPVLLRVNHEAREVAKRFYKLSFGAIDGKPKYFNCNLDALHLWGVDPDFADRMPFIKDDLAKVQKLAVHGAGLIEDEDQYGRLQYFNSLKTLLIEEPSDHIGIISRQKFHNKINSAAKRLSLQISAQQPEASSSARAALKNGNQGGEIHDHDKLELASASSVTLCAKSTVEAASSEGIVEEMPDVGTTIDQAIAETRADVDMLINEEIADITSMDAVSITRFNVVKEEAITQIVIDFRTFTYTSSKTKQVVKATGSNFDEIQRDQPTAFNDSVMDVDDYQDVIIRISEEPVEQIDAIRKIGSASTVNGVANTKSDTTAKNHNIPCTSSTNSPMDLEGNRQPMVRVPKQVANCSKGVTDFGAFKMVSEKAEEILEIAIMPSQWPKRINKAKRFWKWNFAKRRADNIWGTGRYSNQIPCDYGNQLPILTEVPASPLSPKSAALRVGSNEALVARRLQQISESTTSCACKIQNKEIQNIDNTPVVPLQGNNGNYRPIGHLAPIEVKSAENAIIPNAVNLNRAQYISPYTVMPQQIPKLRGNTARGNSQGPMPYQIPYAPNVYGQYTHTAPDAVRYVSPYGFPLGGNAAGSFGVLQLGYSGRSGSLGQSSNRGKGGPMAGPIPIPHYVSKTASATGGGSAYYVDLSSGTAKANGGEIATGLLSNKSRGASGVQGATRNGPCTGQGSFHSSTSAHLDGDTTDEDISDNEVS